GTCHSATLPARRLIEATITTSVRASLLAEVSAPSSRMFWIAASSSSRSTGGGTGTTGVGDASGSGGWAALRSAPGRPIAAASSISSARIYLHRKQRIRHHPGISRAARSNERLPTKQQETQQPQR